MTIGVVTTNADKMRLSRKSSFVNNNNNEVVKNKSPLRYQHQSTSRHHYDHHLEREYEMDINDERLEDDDVDPEEEELLHHKQEQFESLAQELKVKLSSGCGPILLPPRDYDTISRGRGNLSGIEQRKSTNKQIVGVLAEIKAKQQRLRERQEKQQSCEKSCPTDRNKSNSNMQSPHRLQQQAYKQQQVLNTSRSESSSGKSSGIGSDEALAVIPESFKSPSRKSAAKDSDNKNILLKKSSEALSNHHRLHSSSSSSDRRSRSCQRDSEEDDDHDDDFNNDPHQNHGSSSLRAWKILSDELRERGDIPPPVIPSHNQRSMASSAGDSSCSPSSSDPMKNSMKLKGSTYSSSTPHADKTSSGKGDTPKYYFPDPSFKSSDSSSKNSSSPSKLNDINDETITNIKFQGRKKSAAPAIPSSDSHHNIYLELGLSSSSSPNSRSGSKSQHQLPSQVTSITNSSNNGVKSRCYPSSCIVQETGNMNPHVSSSSSSRHVILDTNLCKLKQ
jgi:hypothetical protein